MNSYNFKYKYKNSWFWKNKKVIGHGVDYVEELYYDSNNKIVNKIKKPLDAMIIYLTDGGVERIPNWSNYFLKLDSDWQLFLKNKMEQESGIEIKLNNKVE